MTVPRVAIGNLTFSVMPLTTAIASLLNAAYQFENHDRTAGIAIHFCNAYNVAIAAKDANYAELVNSGTYTFSDGVPITWVGKKARPDLVNEWTRVYGPDVMTGVLSQSTGTSPRHYLLGSTPEVLQALITRIHTAFPNANVVGSESPSFGTPSAEELTARDERIRQSGASIVWVGLGTPKQDYEVARLARQLPLVAVAVGAAFDFLSGSKPQAPTWMQRSGLEWVFRLGTEPGRLWHRYLWGNSIFLAEAFRTVRKK